MSKIWAFLFPLLLSIGCTGSGELSNLKDYSENEALLANQLPVDGCDWHFGVDLGDEWGQYVADDKSKPKVDKIIQAAANEANIWNIKVWIRYRLTGRQKEVECGWRTTTKMDEIEVLEIKRL